MRGRVFVWPIPMTDPETVGLLAVPDDGLQRSGNFKLQAVLSSRYHWQSDALRISLFRLLSHYAQSGRGASKVILLPFDG